MGVSTLFLGAFLSALLSKVPYAFNFIGVLSYSICPFAGVGFGVAYIFKRKNNANDIKVFAEKVLEYIEDSLETEGAIAGFVELHITEKGMPSTEKV